MFIKKVLWVLVFGMVLAANAGNYNIRPSDTTTDIPLGEVSYPVTIYIRDCILEATVFKPDTTTELTRVQLSEGNCAAKTHYVILDDFAYIITNATGQNQTIYIDIGNGADIFWVQPTNITGCHTVSGNPLDTTSSNLPTLLGNTEFFMVDLTKPIKVLYNQNGDIGYQIQSTNTDVICDNALTPPVFGQGSDLIFKNGFD